MLSKFFSRRKTLTSLSQSNRSKQPSAPPPPPEKSYSALRIVHAGGLVESYYMAIPAIRIMEKYPSFILARPEVFRQPWNSIVRPDEILVPGQKFFVVPRRTISKLRRRIKRPSTGIHVDSVDSDEGSVKTAGEGGDSSTAEIGDEESFSPASSCGGERRKVRSNNIMGWKPSLFAINES